MIQADRRWHQGLGEYYLRASVPSPVFNILCADLTKEELTPFVYTLWDRKLWTNGTEGAAPNATNWPNDFTLDIPSEYETTAVDDLFAFDTVQRHPIIAKLPLDLHAAQRNQGLWS